MYHDNLFHGARVRLTAPRAEDVHTWARWYEDSEFARLFNGRPAYPRSLNRMQSYVDELLRPADTSFPFAIRLYDDETMIGFVDLDDIHWTHGTAWLGIAIGDPANRRLGYGTEALRLVLNYGFRELNLHRVQLTVFSYNQPAIRLYERLGFVREGVQREALRRDDQRYDVLLYGLLRHEWNDAL